MVQPIDLERIKEEFSDIMLEPLPPELQKILSKRYEHRADIREESPVDMSDEHLRILQENGYATVERRETVTGETKELHITDLGHIAMQDSDRRWYGPDYFS